MSNRKSNYDEALEQSRRQFLKNSISVAVGLGAVSILGLPELAHATGKTVAIDPKGEPRPWQGGVTQDYGSYNLLTGNYLFTYPVACADSLDFILYHNSTSTATGGPLGAKWRHSFSGQITTSLGKATYIAADGSTYDFAVSGSTYTAPVGCWKSLVHNLDGTWTLSDLQGTLNIHFLSNGALDAVRNSLSGAVLIQCTYNGSGQLTSVQKGGDTLSFGYTSGLLTSVTDLTGAVHTLTYTSGVLTGHSLPSLGGTVYTTQFAYNAQGVVNQITDHAGNSSSYTFSSTGLLTGTTDAAGNSATYVCGNSNPVSGGGWPLNVVAAGVVTLPAGADQYGFDGNGRLVAYAGVSSDRSVYAYDANNNLTSQTLAGGGGWSWTHDSVGRPLTATDPSGVVTTYTLDSAGRTTAQSTGGISTPTRAFDSNSQITSISGGGGDSFTIAYDSNLNPTSFTDTTTGAQALTTFDSSGKMTAMTNVMGYSESFSYTNNLLSSQTDARGRITNYTRDAWGRVTAVAFPTTGHTSESWGYNVQSNLTSGSNAAGSYSYVLNNLGKRTSKTGPEGTVSATFDSSNRPSTVTDTAGRSHTFNWGSNNAISSIALSDGTGPVQYTYNSNNQVLSCTPGNGMVIQYGYDTTSRLVSVSNKVASTSALIVSYTAAYNSTTGLISQITEQPSGAVTSFSYDSYGRLTQETRTGTSIYQGSYTYNSHGQIQTAVRSENGVTSHNGAYTYSAAGYLTQVVDSATSTTENYTWYHDATLASFPGPGYTRELDYYEDGKLLSISRNYGSGGVLAYEFAYDPDGCLAWYKDYVLGTITRFACGTGLLAGRVLIASQKPISSGTWAEIARYIQGPNRIVAVSGSYFADAVIGGPFLSTNSSVATIGTCLFDSFGVVRYSTGVLTSLPGNIVLDGITISIPSGSASIPERYLQIC
ncbi:DUF6531 domain-containing protein [Fimbriimonas ginsengisoli]|uniref:YD repeat-containing protein n=1 Tax=Fimbriimonas ginsengisoli Gsoil 348 TaxID=661478 RepID=A0A068NLS6_FIMGI|nr:DUF6531 domain-containing protein [Fimbriimonas ginsengisoli]AIE83720.1 YD repeat-containing protein [Fimbriimonas ginsengisoli Gsoil 348]